MKRTTGGEAPLELVVPGSLDTRTGGYGYDRRIVAALRAGGRDVRVHELPGAYPWPDEAARRAAADAFARLPDGSRVVVDGLAFGALPGLARAHGQRLILIALVHHPLAAESGLSAAERTHLHGAERDALAAATGVVTTSASTAEALAGYGVPAERLVTVTPGTDAAPEALGSAGGSAGGAAGGSAGGSPDGPSDRSSDRSSGGTTHLLCVATLTPRKGHATLLDALARLEHRDWHLHCVGSATRDPATAEALAERVRRLGLDDGRVTLHGEIDDAALAERYARADLFVLATRYEGYGMVFDEALARALPIVASGAGAVASTVPTDAGLLVAPDDVDALHAALARWFDDPALRERLRAGARRARAGLRSWQAAGAAFARAVDTLSARDGPVPSASS